MLYLVHMPNLKSSTIADSIVKALNDAGFDDKYRSTSCCLPMVHRRCLKIAGAGNKFRTNFPTCDLALPRAQAGIGYRLMLFTTPDGSEFQEVYFRPLSSLQQVRPRLDNYPHLRFTIFSLFRRSSTLKLELEKNGEDLGISVLAVRMSRHPLVCVKLQCCAVNHTKLPGVVCSPYRSSDALTATKNPVQIKLKQDLDGMIRYN